MIAFALAGFDDRATAQSYSPPTPVEYYPRPPAPPAVYPSNQPQTFTSAPLPPPEAGPQPTGTTSALYGAHRTSIAMKTAYCRNSMLPVTTRERQARRRGLRLGVVRFHDRLRMSAAVPRRKTLPAQCATRRIAPPNRPGTGLR